MIVTIEDYLAHYGTPRHSGRYPWGSGGEDSARNRDLLGTIASLKKQGMTDDEIRRGFDMTTTEWRAAKSIATNQQKAERVAQAQKLRDTGMSTSAIGREMGLNESSVRALLAPGAADRADRLTTTTNMLKDQIEKKQYIDVGKGVENHLGISDSQLKTAVAALKQEGYKLQYVKVPQLGTSHETTMKVLTKPDVPWSELNKNQHLITQPFAYSEDGGKSFKEIGPPVSLDSKRLAVRYKEQGGTEADGVMYIRPGAKGLDLGKSNYAQVRIAVDGTHYLKGMALYKEDLPKGVDILFNTNKSDTGNKLDALKKMNELPEGGVDLKNPFGAVINRQSGHLNIVNEEGAWGEWSKTLSSQFLSKQSPTLIKSQLDMTFEGRRNQLNEIMRLTNPAVRRKMLHDFSEDADAAAVHLKAAHMPRQASHVIIPINSLKENEIYAPNYKDGERVVLVRHPHGGTFEIPELTVNNKNPEGRTVLGHGPNAARDAVGIHAKVAERLSGADFDGDTVLVIPNNSNKVLSTRPLEDLKGFDPKRDYAPYDGMKTIDGGVYNAAEKKVVYPAKGPTAAMQNAMGNISNLITDMTIKGASPSELARAVKHSMVVIDAQKHHLDYKRSAQDNGITQLKAKYQLREEGSTSRRGASTLISRKKTDVRVPEQKQGYRIDPATGKRVFVETGASFVGREGNVVQKTTKVKLLDRLDNAHDLSSGMIQDKLYADYSNKVKGLANEARKAEVETKSTPISSSAKQVYKPQVERLDSALQLALRNAPLERQAQLLANAMVRQQLQANPNLEKDQIKKIKSQALMEGRRRTGAGKTRIYIEDDEWKAIQAGAISSTKLKDILDNADMDRVKELATPRAARVMTSSVTARAHAMLADGYSITEVANHLGIAPSTLRDSIGTK